MTSSISQYPKQRYALESMVLVSKQRYALETMVLDSRPVFRPKIAVLQGRRLYIFKVFVEYPLNHGSGSISMFSVNLIFDTTLMMQLFYFFLQKSPTFWAINV